MSMNMNSEAMLIMLANALLAQPRISLVEERELIDYLNANYYDMSTLQRTFVDMYVKILSDYRRMHQGAYPTRRDFFIMGRRTCMCELSVQLTDDEFVQAAEFLMKHTGDIFSNQCECVYYYKEFYTIEHRAPRDFDEFTEYVARSVLASRNPEAFFTTMPSYQPVSNEKKEELVNEHVVRNVIGESCGICQESISHQDAIKLECGHYFHSKTDECCENGTIITWLETNRVCPICRHKVE